MNRYVQYLIRVLKRKIIKVGKIEELVGGRIVCNRKANKLPEFIRSR